MEKYMKGENAPESSIMYKDFQELEYDAKGILQAGIYSNLIKH